MIVADTSAIVAVLLGEPEAAQFITLLSSEGDVWVSAMSDYEIRLVAFHRQGEAALADYQSMADCGDIAIAPFDARQAAVAFAAYRRFGKGNHAARLNFADCASYALAKSLNAPLLFKGADFARTDVRRAL